MSDDDETDMVEDDYPKRPTKVRTSITISPKLLDQARKRAYITGDSVSKIVGEALEGFFTSNPLQI